MTYSSNHSSDTVHGFLTANPWDVTLYTTTVKENKRIKRIKAPCGGGTGKDGEGWESPDQSREVFGTDVIFSSPYIPLPHTPAFNSDAC